MVPKCQQMLKCQHATKYRRARLGSAGSIPSFLIRDQSVERLRPSSAAAPFGPASTPPVCSSALRMWRRSASSSVHHVVRGDRDVAGRPRCGALQDAPLAQDDGALEDVRQLAHVARPVVGDELIERARIDLVHLPAQAARRTP